MNAAQTKEVARIAVGSAIEFLAKKHNTTAIAVHEAIAAGNGALSAQFAELVKAAMREGAALCAEAVAA